MGSLFFEGLVLQASLIFALGAQNLFVLEAGLRRQHHLMVSFVCFLCDLVLILLGVAGAATLFAAFPGIKILVGILGVTFLFSYGVSKLFSSDISTEAAVTKNLDTTLKRSIILAATFSILNPHAYLDAFILIGGFSTKYEALQDRLVLGLGAGFYSGLWFVILSSFSSFMKPVLEHPGRMRVVMSVAGCVLIFLSAKLGLDVMDWIRIEFHPQMALHELIKYPLPPGTMFTTILY
jgi:L-lysine exporter family protein LysE/ArgO